MQTLSTLTHAVHQSSLKGAHSFGSGTDASIGSPCMSLAASIEPKALPLEEVSPPKDPAIASLRNHGALTLEELASLICPAYRISLDRLRSLSRARDLTSVRVDFITQA